MCRESMVRDIKETTEYKEGERKRDLMTASHMMMMMIERDEIEILYTKVSREPYTHTHFLRYCLTFSLFLLSTFYQTK